MILWISGIIEAEVNAAFFSTMNFVQSKLDKIASTTDLGGAIEEIRVVFVVNRDPVTEFRRFTKKDKTLDARVQINYDEFRYSSEVHRVKMFVDAMVGVIEKTVNFTAAEFDKTTLVDKLQTIASQQ